MVTQKLGKPYKSWYEPDKNPHNSLYKISNPGKTPIVWKCKYCGQEGTLDELNKIECGYEYPPCPSCGCTPICAKDCPGIDESLSNQSVHIVGFDPTKN